MGELQNVRGKWNGKLYFGGDMLKFIFIQNLYFHAFFWKTPQLLVLLLTSSLMHHQIPDLAIISTVSFGSFPSPPPQYYLVL